MVRQFRLINEKGQEFSLMDLNNFCFLSEPSGLGYSYNTTYKQIGNSFVDTLRNVQQGPINGIANFSNYDNFKKFVDYVENSEKLRFGYKIPYKNIPIKEYFKDVKIQSIEKGQIDVDGILKCNVAFDCLSLWYEENKTIYTTSAQDREIRWNFRWDSKFVDYNNRILEYINKGHVSAPVTVKIKGPVSKPKLTLKVEGNIYQEVLVNVDLKEYETFEYSTQEKDFYIRKENTDGTYTDLFELEYINPANNNVIKFPQNKSCELILSAENDILSAEIVVYAYYKVV